MTTQTVSHTRLFSSLAKKMEQCFKAHPIQRGVIAMNTGWLQHLSLASLPRRLTISDKISRKEIIWTLINMVNQSFTFSSWIFYFKRKKKKKRKEKDWWGISHGLDLSTHRICKHIINKNVWYILVSFGYNMLTHWGPNKIDVSQTSFSDAFSWMKMFVFWFKFH